MDERSNSPERDIPEERLMLTGDGNIVETAPNGNQVAIKGIDTSGQGGGTLFCIAVTLDGSGVWLVDDGNNTLALGPGVVVDYERNSETNARLRDDGIEVVAIAGSELGTGRGGPRCMSSPVLQDSLE